MKERKEKKQQQLQQHPKFVFFCFVLFSQNQFHMNTTNFTWYLYTCWSLEFARGGWCGGRGML